MENLSPICFFALSSCLLPVIVWPSERLPHMHSATMLRILWLALTAALSAAAALAADKITPGEFIIDHPTLINLGFEWMVDGDDNRNAKVEVSYRKQGETPWKQALPLLRLQGERIYQNQGVFDV